MGGVGGGAHALSLLDGPLAQVFAPAAYRAESATRDHLEVLQQATQYQTSASVIQRDANSLMDWEPADLSLEVALQRNVDAAKDRMRRLQIVQAHFRAK